MIPVGYPFDRHRLGAFNLPVVSWLPGEADLSSGFYCAHHPARRHPQWDAAISFGQPSSSGPPPASPSWSGGRHRHRRRVGSVVGSSSPASFNTRRSHHVGQGPSSRATGASGCRLGPQRYERRVCPSPRACPATGQTGTASFVRISLPNLFIVHGKRPFSDDLDFPCIEYFWGSLVKQMHEDYRASN